MKIWEKRQMSTLWPPGSDARYEKVMAEYQEESIK